ncbi:ribonuclease H-like domain-containing protein [Paenibacillus sp. PR3]|uniref:Ribonuclease H-like domain-containing protein n=1 Tax=Paenibacillus terricola TaxID=2763503 RepID=A0ABR8MSI1_9BACL|nr:ribonuclease H-like domain-containing protein [Paenibacillus terricola]MBD3918939.1 ribonuclease H-like domain-containing protein [Paenibacillus terricola]
MSAFRDRFNRLRGEKADVSAAATADTVIDAESVGNVPAEEHVGVKDLIVEQSDSESPPEWLPYDVRLVRNEMGEFLAKEIRYPLDYHHGHHSFGEWGEAVRALTAFHGDEQVMGAASAGTATASFVPLRSDNVLFLDLETTGLGAGTGNVPFMLGIAYFEGEHYVVRQSIIRHPAEERAMLADLKARLPQFQYLVTFNGRTFDWPLIQSRFIMNGFGSKVWEPLHLDFLHPSRSIWRNTLVSCKLSYVEEERLGVFREDDLPGSEAPGRYFAYLADGDPKPLLDVFRHNEIDMLSLAALAIRFGHLLAGRIGSAVPMPTEAEELVRTGLWLERMGEETSAAPLLANVRRVTDASPSVWNRLAERDKRLGQWEDAISLWNKAASSAERSFLPDWDAHIELSMYYEHKVKDVPQALIYARSALELALEQPLSGRADSKRRKEIDALRHRLDRLMRKAGK